MNEIDKFKRLLHLKKAAKEIQQLSWSISKFEARFPLEELDNKKLDSLIGFYEGLANDLHDITYSFIDDIE